MSISNWIPDDVPLDRPSPSRMYDYFLGGHHNLEIDRQAADHVMQIYPDARLASHANRAFLRRVVTFLVKAGIDQFLDIGSGIPTVGNVHEIAFRANLEARVVYVDKDPVAVAHSEAILKDIPNAAIVQADACQPETIYEHIDVRQMLDFDKPVAALMLLVLPFLAEDEAAAHLVQATREALSPGSYLAISHGTQEKVPPEVIEQLEQLYVGTTNPARVRSRDRINDFFAGFDLIEPGMVYLPLWRPEGTDGVFYDEPERSTAFGAVGQLR